MANLSHGRIWGSIEGGRKVGEPYGFAEINEYVYHSVRGVFFGGVIWCLGPVVDDSRNYAWPRMWLAAATYRVCRRVLRVED